MFDSKDYSKNKFDFKSLSDDLDYRNISILYQSTSENTYHVVGGEENSETAGVLKVFNLSHVLEENELSVLNQLFCEDLGKFTLSAKKLLFLPNIMQLFTVRPYYEIYSADIHSPDIERHLIEIGEGLLELHNNKIIHSNLTPSNILYDKVSDKIKICDYGLIYIRKNNVKKKETKYLSPEELSNKELDISVDKWNYGLLLYKYIIGEDLFKDEDVDKIMRCEYEVSKDSPYMLKEILKLIIEKEVNKRIEICKIIELLKKNQEPKVYEDEKCEAERIFEEIGIKMNHPINPLPVQMTLNDYFECNRREEMKSTNENINFIVGIDFGGNNYVLSGYDNRIEPIVPKIIEDVYSQKKTQLFIDMTNNRLFGKSTTAVKNFKNVITTIKDLFGKKFSETSEILKNHSHYPESIIEIENDEIGFRIHNIGLGEKILNVNDIYSSYANHIYEYIKEKNNMDKIKCILSVPCDYNNYQIELLRRIFESNGFKKVEIIPEYLSCSLCFGYENDSKFVDEESKKKVLFVDMGYLKTNICLNEYGKNEVKIIQTKTINDLGGMRIDNILINHFRELIENEMKIDIFEVGKEKNYIKVKNEIIKMKEKLSAQGASDINVSIDLGDDDFDSTFSVNELNDLVKKNGIDKELKEGIKAVLNESKISNEEKRLIEVVIVGGSLRIPLLQTTIENYLDNIGNEIKINRTINMDEDISYGNSYYGLIEEGKWKYNIVNYTANCFICKENNTSRKLDDVYEKFKRIDMEYKKINCENRPYYVYIVVVRLLRNKILGYRICRITEEIEKMISEVTESESDNPFKDLISVVLDLINNCCENEDEEEKNAVISSLIKIEVEHSKNIENQIKYYDDNQQRIAELKNDLERQIYEYQHFVGEIDIQNEKIEEFSQYLSTLLIRIKQKNTPYTNINSLTKDIEELKGSYNKCFGYFNEFLNHIKTEVRMVPNSHPMKTELCALINNYLAVIPEDTKQVMELYNIVYEKYEILVNEAFNTLKLHIKSNVCELTDQESLKDLNITNELSSLSINLDRSKFQTLSSIIEEEKVINGKIKSIFSIMKNNCHKFIEKKCNELNQYKNDSSIAQNYMNFYLSKVRIIKDSKEVSEIIKEWNEINNYEKQYKYINKNSLEKEINNCIALLDIIQSSEMKHLYKSFEDLLQQLNNCSIELTDLIKIQICFNENVGKINATIKLLIDVEIQSMKDLFGNENSELNRFYTSINIKVQDASLIYAEYKKLLQYNKRYLEQQKIVILKNIGNIEKEVSLLNSKDELILSLKSLIDEYKPKINNKSSIKVIKEYENKLTKLFYELKNTFISKIMSLKSNIIESCKLFPVDNSYRKELQRFCNGITNCNTNMKCGCLLDLYEKLSEKSESIIPTEIEYLQKQITDYQYMISSLTEIDTSVFQKLLKQNSELLKKPDIKTEDIQSISNSIGEGLQICLEVIRNMVNQHLNNIENEIKAIKCNEIKNKLENIVKIIKPSILNNKTNASLLYSAYDMMRDEYGKMVDELFKSVDIQIKSTLEGINDIKTDSSIKNEIEVIKSQFKLDEKNTITSILEVQNKLNEITKIIINSMKQKCIEEINKRKNELNKIKQEMKIPNESIIYKDIDNFYTIKEKEISKQVDNSSLQMIWKEIKEYEDHYIKEKVDYLINEIKENKALVSEIETTDIKEYQLKIEKQLSMLESERIDFKQFYIIQNTIENEKNNIVALTTKKVVELENKMDITKRKNSIIKWPDIYQYLLNLEEKYVESINEQKQSISKLINETNSVLNEITIKNDAILNVRGILDQPICNDDLKNMKNQYNKIVEGMNNVNKSIKSEINDLIKATMNYIKGFDNEKVLIEEVNRIKNEGNKNKDTKSIWLIYTEIKNKFNNLLPNEISKCKSEIQLFEKLLVSIEEGIKIDEYKENYNKMYEIISSSDVDLKEISEVRKMIKADKDKIEKEIKNQIDNYLNVIKEARQKLQTADSYNKKLSTEISNNSVKEKGIKNSFDQLLRIKSFVEKETKNQNKKLKSLIEKCENELQEIEVFNSDKSLLEKIKSVIENVKNNENDTNLTLSIIFEMMNKINIEYKSTKRCIVKMIKEELDELNSISNMLKSEDKSEKLKSFLSDNYLQENNPLATQIKQLHDLRSKHDEIINNEKERITRIIIKNESDLESVELIPENVKKYKQTLVDSSAKLQKMNKIEEMNKHEEFIKNKTKIFVNDLKNYIKNEMKKSFKTVKNNNPVRKDIDKYVNDKTKRIMCLNSIQSIMEEYNSLKNYQPPNISTDSLRYDAGCENTGDTYKDIYTLLTKKRSSLFEKIYNDKHITMFMALYKTNESVDDKTKADFNNSLKMLIKSYYDELKDDIHLFVENTKEKPESVIELLNNIPDEASSTYILLNYFKIYDELMTYYDNLRKLYKIKINELKLNCEENKQFIDVDSFLLMEISNSFYRPIKDDVKKTYDKKHKILVEEITKIVSKVKEDIKDIKKDSIYESVNKEIYDNKDYKKRVEELENELKSFNKANINNMLDIYNVNNNINQRIGKLDDYYKEIVANINKLYKPSPVKTTYEEVELKKVLDSFANESSMKNLSLKEKSNRISRMVDLYIKNEKERILLIVNPLLEDLDDISKYYKLNDVKIKDKEDSLNIVHQISIFKNHDSTLLKLKTALKNFPQYVEVMRKTIYQDYKNQLEFTRYGIKDSVFEGINSIPSVDEALSLNELLKRSVNKENGYMELRETREVVEAMKEWSNIIKLNPWKSVVSLIQKNCELKKDLIKKEEWNEVMKDCKKVNISTAKDLNEFVKKINEKMIKPITFKKQKQNNK